MREPVVHEEGLPPHPEILRLERPHGPPRDDPAVGPYLHKLVDEGPTDEPHGPQVRLRPDQCFASPTSPGHDVSGSGHREVTGLVGRAGGPHCPVFEVAPRDQPTIGTRAEGDQALLRSHDDSVRGRSVRHGHEVVGDVQIPLIDLAVC